MLNISKLRSLQKLNYIQNMKKLLSELKNKKYLIILFTTGIIHLLFVYGHVLKDPNNFLSVNGGDGMKNYYAYITEVSKHGTTNQLSFNYPYGESYLFTDSHPFLSRTLHYVNKIFPCTEQYSIGILNVLMIISIFFTYLVLFLLIKRFIKEEWYALLWAFAIMLLQPQINRISGHYALSYSFAIPLCFYWTVLYYQTNKKILYGVLLLLSNFLWLGTHAYLGVMTCSFTFLFDAYQWFCNKNYRNFKNNSLIFLKSVLPLVSFFIYLTVIDTHTGRTTNSGGFFSHYASLESIFLPNEGWGARFLQNIISKPLDRTWEGFSYIGLVSTICVFTVVFVYIKRLYNHYIKKRTRQKFPFEIGLFAPAMFAAVVCLLFSMNYPFKLGLQFLLDWITLINNFRSTGRFAWTFFFVATTFSAYAIYQYVHITMKNKRKIFTYLILIGLPVFTIIEAIPYQESVRKLFKTKNVFLQKNLNSEYQKALESINSAEYQAVIPLPFFQGSGNFSKPAPNRNIENISSIFSYHFELPLMASQMARTSIWESKNLTQMFAPEYYEKLIAEDIPSDKKFLIVCLSEHNLLTEYERDFLKKATFLLKANDVEFWEITPAKITEVVSKPYITDFYQKRDSLIFKNDYFLSKADTTVFLFSFDENVSQYTFLGKGAYEQPENENRSIFAEIEAGKLEENREYEISLWYYVGGENYGQDKLSWKIFISQKNDVSGEKIPLVEKRSRKQGNPVVLGDWALASYRFSIKNKDFSTQFAISKTQCKGYQTTIDEILLRPIDVDVYRILEEDQTGIKKLYKNGQIIKQGM